MYSYSNCSSVTNNIVFNNAYNAIPAQFISLEENETQISQRFYSKFFEIPYTDLHKGQANQILEHEFVNPAFEERRNVLAKNLSLIGLKGLTPITTDQIYEVMVRKYEKTAFVPKIVVIDQLQFIQAMHTRKSDSTWNEEKQAAMELDELSHKAIGGHHFALWVLHQAKGKLRRHFSRDEIDGFKGIIHKTDLTLGIGRDGINTHEADIFSLKVRHCSDFITTLGADFKYMRFIDRPRQESMAMEGYSTANRNPMSPAANSNALPELPDEIPAPPQMPS